MAHSLNWKWNWWGVKLREEMAKSKCKRQKKENPKLFFAIGCNAFERSFNIQHAYAMCLVSYQLSEQLLFALCYAGLLTSFSYICSMFSLHCTVLVLVVVYFTIYEIVICFKCFKRSKTNSKMFSLEMKRQIRPRRNGIKYFEEFKKRMRKFTKMKII